LNYGESQPVDYEKAVEHSNALAYKGTLNQSATMASSFFPIIEMPQAREYVTCQTENSKRAITKSKCNPLPFSAQNNNRSLQQTHLTNFTKPGELFCRRNEERTYQNKAKIVHSSGRSAKIEFNIVNPMGYTGIFKNAGKIPGLIRLSMGVKPAKRNEKRNRM